MSSIPEAASARERSENGRVASIGKLIDGTRLAIFSAGNLGRYKVEIEKPQDEYLMETYNKIIKDLQAGGYKIAITDRGFEADWSK